MLPILDTVIIYHLFSLDDIYGFNGGGRWGYVVITGCIFKVVDVTSEI